MNADGMQIGKLPIEREWFWCVGCPISRFEVEVMSFLGSRFQTSAARVLLSARGGSPYLNSLWRFSNRVDLPLRISSRLD